MAPPPAAPSTRTTSSVWKRRYGDRHRPHRISEFPDGVAPPQKVRLYRRGHHYLLQWWDRAAGRTLTQRVEGDVIDAVAEARKIDARLVHYGRSGAVAARIDQATLVESYLTDLSRRAEAGEIDASTVRRYTAALQRHYLPFVEQPAIARRFARATQINREFQQEFAAFLRSRQVTSNGRAAGRQRPLGSQTLIVGIVRSMVSWAADPDRGNLLPEGFRNPFRGSGRKGTAFPSSSLAPPDITLPMAANLLQHCDAHQLPLFALLALGGLRPDELGWLFCENVRNGWLGVVSLPGIEYATKGRRDKRLLLPQPLLPLWFPSGDADRKGLLLRRRGAAEQARKFPCYGCSLEQLTAEFARRVGRLQKPCLSQRLAIRDRLLREAGGLTYDRTRREFANLQTALGWPPAATLKDFRHLFATALENAGVPTAYRQFYLGHSPGRAPLVTYTHLDQLERQLAAAHRTTLAPLVEAVLARGRALKLLGG